MEEQQNLNNIPADQPNVTTEQKNIPTVAGALIILVVAVIVGAGLFYFLQTDNNSAVTDKFSTSKTETVDTEENVTASQDQIEEKSALPATDETFNFDYELKKLDDQNNTVSSDDFNENEMSDANIGL
jgi:uncharacterized protein HemX